MSDPIEGDLSRGGLGSSNSVRLRIPVQQLPLVSALRLCGMLPAFSFATKLIAVRTQAGEGVCRGTPRVRTTVKCYAETS